jgi:CheY-like chemotaxis protein
MRCDEQDAFYKLIMKTQSFKILIANHDQAISLTVSTILRRQGHTVEVVQNGKEAINLVTIKPDYFEVLIADHDMPLVSGLEVADHLRKNGYQVKIIVLSGSLTSELLKAQRNKLVDNILQKPFTPEDLSSALTGILGAWQGIVYA